MFIAFKKGLSFLSNGFVLRDFLLSLFVVVPLDLSNFDNKAKKFFLFVPVDIGFVASSFFGFSLTWNVFVDLSSVFFTSSFFSGSLEIALIIFFGSSFFISSFLDSSFFGSIFFAHYKGIWVDKR